MLMDPNQKLMAEQSEPFLDPNIYKRLMEKLIYLTITRPVLSFAVGVVSQFMQGSLHLLLECCSSHSQVPQKGSRTRSTI